MFAIISEAPHCNYFIYYLSILMQLHCMTLQCIQKYPTPFVQVNMTHTVLIPMGINVLVRKYYGILLHMFAFYKFNGRLWFPSSG